MILYTSVNNDLSFVYLIIILTLIIIFGVVIYIYFTFLKLKKVFQNIALKRNGQVLGPTLSPRLVFEYNENKVLIYITKASRYTPTYTNIEIKFFPPSDKDFMIYVEKFISKIGKALGMQDIQIGNPDFDSKFIIKGDDVLFVKSLLPGYIQLLFLEIYRFNPYIYLEDDKLKIQIPKFIKKREEYDILLDTFLKFINHYHEYKKMFLG